MRWLLALLGIYSYIDKTKAARWIGSGLQLPSTLTTPNGFIASIQDPSSPVNPYVAAVVNHVANDSNGNQVNKYYLDVIVDGEGYRFNVQKENPAPTKIVRTSDDADNGRAGFSSITRIAEENPDVNSLLKSSRNRMSEETKAAIDADAYDNVYYENFGDVRRSVFAK